jgi:hypothetical protein
LFFQRRKKYQVGTASQFDAARVRRKIARVTGERAHALQSHMLVFWKPGKGLVAQ